MTDWPYGISTGCFYKTPFEESLRYIRDGGFTLIEVCSYPEHLDCHNLKQVAEAANAVDRMGIEPFSLHAPFADNIDIASLDREVRKHSIREMMVACEAAATLGARQIVVHPGPEKEGRPVSSEWYDRSHNAADSLNQVAERCRELGIYLLLENMLPHLMFGHICDMLFLLGSINNTMLGTCLDTGHAYLSGDLHTVVHKLSGHLKMIHANDNRGDRDDHLPPGDGDIDWQALIHQLRHYRFQGTIILELNGNGTPDEIMDGARRSRKYLRQLCRKAEMFDQEWGKNR
ncbi:MAG: sugar phosphate isomerase/epimerase [Verrucomicrobiales bacterium]|nr:sugar phosphate isomerase/epimerase [Verrucomicrobiales bacterium]